MSGPSQPPSFKTDIHRAKTKKWVTAPVNDYGGGDWDVADEYNEYGSYDDEPEAPQHPIPQQQTTDFRGHGQSASISSASGRRASNAAQQPPALHRVNSYEQDDESRTFSTVASPTVAQGTPSFPAHQFDQRPLSTTQAYSPQFTQSTSQRQTMPAGYHQRVPSLPRHQSPRFAVQQAEPTHAEDGEYDDRSYPGDAQNQGLGLSTPNDDEGRHSWLPPLRSELGSDVGAQYYTAGGHQARLPPFPPRKSSLSSKSRPDLHDLYRNQGPSSQVPPMPPHQRDYETNIQDTESKPATREVKEEEHKEQPANAPKFIRPADIYKRMAEEREKERQSLESARPSPEKMLAASPDPQTSNATKKEDFSVPALDAGYYGTFGTEQQPSQLLNERVQHDTAGTLASQDDQESSRPFGAGQESLSVGALDDHYNGPRRSADHPSRALTEKVEHDTADTLARNDSSLAPSNVPSQENLSVKALDARYSGRPSMSEEPTQSFAARVQHNTADILAKEDNDSAVLEIPRSTRQSQNTGDLSVKALDAAYSGPRQSQQLSSDSLTERVQHDTKDAIHHDHDLRSFGSPAAGQPRGIDDLSLKALDQSYSDPSHSEEQPSEEMKDRVQHDTADSLVTRDFEPSSPRSDHQNTDSQSTGMFSGLHLPGLSLSNPMLARALGTSHGSDQSSSQEADRNPSPSLPSISRFSGFGSLADGIWGHQSKPSTEVEVERQVSTQEIASQTPLPQPSTQEIASEIPLPRSDTYGREAEPDTRDVRDERTDELQHSAAQYDSRPDRGPVAQTISHHNRGVPSEHYSVASPTAYYFSEHSGSMDDRLNDEQEPDRHTYNKPGRSNHDSSYETARDSISDEPDYRNRGEASGDYGRGQAEQVRVPEPLPHTALEISRSELEEADAEDSKTPRLGDSGNFERESRSLEHSGTHSAVDNVRGEAIPAEEWSYDIPGDDAAADEAQGEYSDSSQSTPQEEFKATRGGQDTDNAQHHHYDTDRQPSTGPLRNATAAIVPDLSTGRTQYTDDALRGVREDTPSREFSQSPTMATREADLASSVNANPRQIVAGAGEAAQAARDDFMKTSSSPSTSARGDYMNLRQPPAPMSKNFLSQPLHIDPIMRQPSPSGRVKQMAEKYDVIHTLSRQSTMQSPTGSASGKNSSIRSNQDPERPHLPGEWVSYADTINSSRGTDRDDDEDDDEYDRADTPTRHLEEHDAATRHTTVTPAAAAHQDEPIDFSPTTNRRNLYGATSEGPSHPLSALAAAGQALASSLMTSVGLQSSNDHDDHESDSDATESLLPSEDVTPDVQDRQFTGFQPQPSNLGRSAVLPDEDDVNSTELEETPSRAGRDVQQHPEILPGGSSRPLHQAEREPVQHPEILPGGPSRPLHEYIQTDRDVQQHPQILLGGPSHSHHDTERKPPQHPEILSGAPSRPLHDASQASRDTTQHPEILPGGPSRPFHETSQSGFDRSMQQLDEDEDRRDDDDDSDDTEREDDDLPPPAPLRPRSNFDRPEHEVTPQRPIWPSTASAMSIAYSPEDTESDRLRKDIVRSLSPGPGAERKSLDVDDNPRSSAEYPRFDAVSQSTPERNMASTPLHLSPPTVHNTSRAVPTETSNAASSPKTSFLTAQPPAATNMSRESTLLPREYDSYWAERDAQDEEDTKTVQQHAAVLPTTLSPVREVTHERQPQQNIPAPVQSREVESAPTQPRNISPARPNYLAKRFSWENADESPPVSSLSSQAPNAPSQTMRSPAEPATGPSATTLRPPIPGTSVQMDNNAPSIISSFTDHSRDVSTPGDPPSQNVSAKVSSDTPRALVAVEPLIGPLPPSVDTSASHNTASSDSSPVQYKYERPFQKQRGPSVSEGAPTGLRKMSSTARPLANSRTISSGHFANRSISTTDTEASLPSFKTIVAMRDTADRIATFDKTREAFATMDTGLDDWLQHMVRANKNLINEPAPAQRSNTTGFAGSMRHKFTPSVAKLTKQPTNTGSPTSPASHNANASIDSFSNPSTSARSPSTAQRRVPSVSASGEPAKGKAFLQSAGIGAKGLFAKGRSKFRGASGEKVVD